MTAQDPQPSRSNTAQSRFIVVTLHLVGNADAWTIEYDTDEHELATAVGALRHGMRTLDHDDFWVCEMRDGKLHRILHSNLERRPLDEEEFAQVREALSRLERGPYV